MHSSFNDEYGVKSCTEKGILYNFAFMSKIYFLHTVLLLLLNLMHVTKDRLVEKYIHLQRKLSSVCGSTEYYGINSMIEIMYRDGNLSTSTVKYGWVISTQKGITQLFS